MARRVGCSAEAFADLWKELSDAGVPSFTGDGIAYSRRMVRDEQERISERTRKAEWRKETDQEIVPPMSQDCPANVPPMSQRSSSSSSSSSLKPKPPPPSAAGFDEFWLAYPKKRAKPHALKVWRNRKCEAIAPQIIAAVRVWSGNPDWLKDSGQYIPHPATWLNAERWLDELPGAASADPRKSLVSDWLVAHKPEAAALFTRLRQNVPAFSSCSDEQLTQSPPREIVDAVEAKRQAAA